MPSTAICPKCGHKNGLPPCSNCNGLAFSTGGLSDGSYGVICRACNCGYSHTPCQGGCGAMLAAVNFHTPMSSFAQNAQAGMKAYDGGQCFIATEIYGRDSSEVRLLRQLRDRRLLPNQFGRKFVSMYYRVSPSIIPLMQRWSLVRVPLRALVAVCVFFVRLNRR